MPGRESEALDRCYLARSATATDGFRQPVARLAARAVLDFGYDKTAL